jgi:hypothetical protein
MSKVKKSRKGKKLEKPLSLYGHSMNEILAVMLSTPPKKKPKEPTEDEEIGQAKQNNTKD